MLHLRNDCGEDAQTSATSPLHPIQYHIRHQYEFLLDTRDCILGSMNINQDVTSCFGTQVTLSTMNTIASVFFDLLWPTEWQEQLDCFQATTSIWDHEKKLETSKIFCLHQSTTEPNFLKQKWAIFFCYECNTYMYINKHRKSYTLTWLPFPIIKIHSPYSNITHTLRYLYNQILLACTLQYKFIPLIVTNCSCNICRF